ncbi:zinc finger, GRF-type [Artemisia annua]|uniref:Zinc finger, GRF-type n=1 Tax=Artemisia annua TaxID=35608 RepID=A0A2U1NHE3_ARTAN|nr:zinc finger, GRF-type [Artemisia annua]
MVRCWCSRHAIIRTSWTNINPGRLFYACPQPGSSCRFIRWFDPPMYARSTVIIPGILRSKNELEAALKACRADLLLQKENLWNKLVNDDVVAVDVEDDVGYGAAAIVSTRSEPLDVVAVDVEDDVGYGAAAIVSTRSEPLGFVSNP